MVNASTKFERHAALAHLNLAYELWFVAGKTADYFTTLIAMIEPGSPRF